MRALDPSSSLLTLPFGRTTVGAHLTVVVDEATSRRPLVVCTFDPGTGHLHALQAAGVKCEVVLGMEDFTALIGAYEPSDWFLFVDPRCSAMSFDPARLFGGLDESPRIVRHLIALDANAGGTSERVEFDSLGRVRRVQRYYDAVTWTVASGVACSLVPVSTFRRRPPVFSSLEQLRSELAARSCPSRDVPMTEPAFDLSTERGLLRLNERALAIDGGGTHESAALDPTARLIGNVAVHEGATVGERAVIVGPSVIGRGARIERGAVVAQAVVAAGATLQAAVTLRHRVAAGVWSDGQGPSDSAEWQPDEDVAPFVDEGPDPSPRLYPRVKTIAEAIVASLGLIVLSPLLALVAILIKLESRGPVFYGDPREAKDGRLFRCYKFRTMAVGAAAAQRDLMKANQMDGPQFKIDRDPRVTRLGRWLRLISLDELPQLFNVAMGQMSLVGPRPSPFRENQTCVPWRDARLSVRPGITGLWQVCRHDRSSGDFHQWIYYDMQYVRNMSFLLDLKILIATAITLGGKGHVPLSWMIAPTSKERV